MRQRKVCERHIVVVLAHVCAREQRRQVCVLEAVRRDGRHATKVVAGELGHLVVVNGAGGRQHHARRGVVCLHVLDDVVGRDRVDVLNRPKDGACEGRAHVRHLVQAVEYDLLYLALDLLHFAEDHVALALHRRL